MLVALEDESDLKVLDHLVRSLPCHDREGHQRIFLHVMCLNDVSIFHAQEILQQEDNSVEFVELNNLDCHMKPRQGSSGHNTSTIRSCVQYGLAATSRLFAKDEAAFFIHSSSRKPFLSLLDGCTTRFDDSEEVLRPWQHLVSPGFYDELLCRCVPLPYLIQALLKRAQVQESDAPDDIFWRQLRYDCPSNVLIIGAAAASAALTTASLGLDCTIVVSDDTAQATVSRIESSIERCTFVPFLLNILCQFLMRSYE